MVRRRMSWLTATALALAALGSGSAVAAATCDPTASAAGDWSLYGHDLHNTRSQPAETLIGPTEVGSIVPDEVFSSAAAAGSGFFQSTPTVAGDCLFAATDGGTVYALNADTLDVVWQRQYLVAQTRLGGVVTGALAFSDGRVFVHVSDAGKPFVAALDVGTGVELWRTVVDTRPGSFINASPVPFDGMLFTGFAGDEYVEEARGGYAILDQGTGDILAKHYTIPDADFARGYWGASIWSTAVYDAASRSLFVGSGNPASHDKEHRYSNALLKIDADPTSARFGEIVDAYKGTVDQYYPGLDRQPVCESAPGVEYGDAWSLTCVQFDVDFGASANLFTDEHGNLIVGALQKSGIYHAVYADSMQQAWTSLVGTPCFVCNVSSPATSGGRVFLAAGQPGQVVAIDGSSGGYRWAMPIADLVHPQSVSVANGVVYAPDLYGMLNAFDAETGTLLLKRDMSSDVGHGAGGVQSSGVAIARNRLYVPAGGSIVAYSTEA